MKWYTQISGDRFASLFESTLTKDGYCLQSTDRIESEHWILLEWLSIVAQSARVTVTIRVANKSIFGRMKIYDEGVCVELISDNKTLTSHFMYSSQYSPFEAVHTEGFRDEILALIRSEIKYETP